MVKKDNGPSKDQIAQTASAFIGKEVEIRKKGRQTPIIGTLTGINKSGIEVEGKKKYLIKYNDFQSIILAKAATGINDLKMPKTTKSNKP